MRDSDTAPDPGVPFNVSTRLVVGMEVHVELATRTKMWTSAPNVAHPDHFNAAPNSLLSPVVIGMPGTLPVMNKAAVEMSTKVGLAMGCAIAERAKWDRKSYHYPDLPKNYQISQYDRPLCGEGLMTVRRDDGSAFDVRITRAHLEEDAGKLLHELPGGGFSDGSLVDLNRAGTPLLEIVTEPDLASADDAVAFCQALRDLCRHLRVTHGVMQRGQIRFEPNINVVITNASGETFRTPIVEVKNLNSFRAVHGAILHEHTRQVEAWAADGKVMSAGSKQTRGWDDAAMVTTLQREKEDAHDYRYFPDPDLVEVVLDRAQVDAWRDALPELPAAKRERYVAELGLKPVDADTLLAEPDTTDLFEAASAVNGAEPKRVASFLLNTAAKVAGEREASLQTLGVSAAQVGGIVALLGGDRINKQSAEKLLLLCCDSDDAPEALAEREKLLQVEDAGEVDAWIDAVLADPKNAAAIADLEAGKGKAIGALLGQIMKLSKGQANPKAIGPKIMARVNGDG